MDASGAVARDCERHGLVIFAVEHADARGGTQVALLEEFEERGILLVDAQDFVGVADFGLGEFYGAVFAAKTRHPTEERHTVRAATLASKTREKQPRYFRRNSMLETLGLFMGARPFQTDNFSEEFFGEAMAQDEMLRRTLPFRGEFDAS